MSPAGIVAGVLASSAASHRGAVRAHNEDRVVAWPEAGLWAVADGAGGHGEGEVASGAIAAALEAIPAELTAVEMLAQVRLRIAGVHAELQRRAPAGGVIASTVVVLLVRGEHFAVLWAGDSRLYLWRGGRLRRVTHDHSLVQELVDAGRLAAGDAEGHPQANVITQAVGQPGGLTLDKVAGRTLAGDRFLLCSDGVFKAVPEGRLAALVRDGADAAALVAAAVAKGARDNVSAVLVVR